jgi:inhibitor of KinA
MKLDPLGDAAVIATLGSGIDAATLRAVLNLSEAIQAAGHAGITDVVPAYASVTAFYDPSKFTDAAGDPYDQVCRFMQACGENASLPGSAHKSRNVEIPVCYGSDFGPDLAALAEHCHMSVEEVIAAHSGADYLVHAIGFTPGFPYLGGLPEALRAHRRDTPRAHVPAGSVGIGGSQTGVYPVDSPGGWQIIGRTPIALFRPSRKPAALLRPGDRVRFTVISPAELESWR